MACLVEKLAGLDSKPLIRAVLEAFGNQVAITSSFGAESAVLLDLVADIDKNVPVIFINTDELFDETLAYRKELADFLGLTNVIDAMPSPDEKAKAEELWQTDPDQCCNLRKVLPLARAVEPFGVLIDGRKKAHGADRERLETVAYQGSVLKVSPLANWDETAIEAHFKSRNLPRHPLVAQGYRSIGCWPCTRPIQPGESPRSGRWAGRAKTECGIHVTPLTGVIRNKDHE